MALVDNGNRATGCILSEANGHRSRANITIVASSGVIAPNTVLAVVDAAAGTYRPAAAADTGVAIALYGCDTTDGAKKIAGLVRDAEVNGKTLVYAATVNTPVLRAAKNTQLAAAGIIVR